MSGLDSPRRRAAIAIATLALGGALAGCGMAARLVEPPPASPAASAALSATLLNARGQVSATLAAARIQVADARVPYRPGESPAVATAPRTVVQAVLPAAPEAGYIVIYELADPSLATGAARELAQYLASGPADPFPSDAEFDPPSARRVFRLVAVRPADPGASGPSRPRSRRSARLRRS
jgi:hypothetical protein